MTRYYESFGYDGKNAPDKRFYHFNGVSVPTEMDYNSQQPLHMPLRD
jgi:hypothetical protein